MCTWWLGNVLELQRELGLVVDFCTPAEAKLARALDDLADGLHAVAEPYLIRRYQSEGGEVWDNLDTAEEALAYARQLRAQSFDALCDELYESMRDMCLDGWRQAHERNGGPGWPAGPDYDD
jgi:hypothetical protein